MTNVGGRRVPAVDRADMRRGSNPPSRGTRPRADRPGAAVTLCLHPPRAGMALPAGSGLRPRPFRRMVQRRSMPSDRFFSGGPGSGRIRPETPSCWRFLPDWRVLLPSRPCGCSYLGWPDCSLPSRGRSSAAGAFFSPRSFRCFSPVVAGMGSEPKDFVPGATNRATTAVQSRSDLPDR